MVNPRRGEIELMIDGKPHTLCLTLGALAELEAKLQLDDLNGLGKRFEAGHISARDMITILGAGLRGAGHAISDQDLESCHIEGGALGAAKAVAQLLHLTFAAPLDQ
ncbi:gene transfer agent family protein [Maritalea mediterranea]|uniref:Gene transfer agent family protein n=1 Tax=Maritalea mediterranea TaxID=2909667 RepID=A0ABS9E954_9HYPH|nr:gene transfer agent family protein [Maritalea mediterranea]MCF4097938.1 gene transfer agent family protein [Maritalea mediterranea]